MQNNQKSFDFILTVYPNYVLLFVQNTYFKCYIKNHKGEDSINPIYSAILNTISNAEKRFNQIFNIGILLIDYEPLSKIKIKVPIKETFDFQKLNFKLEAKLNKKIFVLKTLHSDIDHKEMLAFCSQKNITNNILEIINYEKIEILEAQTIFEVLNNYISKINHYEEYNIVKLHYNYCELFYFQEGILVNYKVSTNLGIKNILERFSKLFNISINDVKTILEHYRFVSSVDRMKKYTEREELDFKLKDFIDNTNFINSIQNELKQYMLHLKGDLRQLNPEHFNVKCYFFCEQEFLSLNLLELNNSKDELITLTNLNFFINAEFNSKKSFLNTLLNKIFLFFRLNS